MAMQLYKDRAIKPFLQLTTIFFFYFFHLRKIFNIQIIFATFPFFIKKTKISFAQFSNFYNT